MTVDEMGRAIERDWNRDRWWGAVLIVGALLWSPLAIAAIRRNDNDPDRSGSRGRGCTGTPLTADERGESNARIAILPGLSLRRLWSACLVALALSMSACCHPTRIDRPVIVREPPCLTRPAPFAPERLADEADDAYMMRFARWYALSLSPWIVEVEAACGGER